MEKQLLTYSSISTFKKCRKRYFWEYECGIRGAIDAKALRMGTAGHAALYAYKRDGIDAAMQAIDVTYAGYYGNAIQDGTNIDLEYEIQTVRCLMAGYDWRWKESPLAVIAAEQAFQMPLVNPESGSASQLFDLAGKIDGIVELQDSRLAVQEHKFLTDSIDPDADLWRRMQIDQQITMYVIAARYQDHAIDTVLYDVIRKPTIKPTAVPVLDDLGMKIVLDKDGNRPMTSRGQYYQTGNTEKGLTLQVREMTADEWGKKLLDDIGERPYFYYVRKELPRLDGEIAEFKAELWDIQKTVRDAQLRDRWFKTVDFNTCSYCAFQNLCLSKYQPSDPLPEGFKVISDVHPELQND